MRDEGKEGKRNDGDRAESRVDCLLPEIVRQEREIEPEEAAF